MTVAIYPGTFDPVHYGHMDIARRAAGLFDKLVVAVYDRPQKSLMFSTEERVKMVYEALSDVPNIEVESYEGLTADFAHERGARVIVRGLRVISDFEREYQMALTTRRLAPDLDMICLMTPGLCFSQFIYRQRDRDSRRIGATVRTLSCRTGGAGPPEGMSSGLIAC